MPLDGIKRTRLVGSNRQLCHSVRGVRAKSCQNAVRLATVGRAQKFVFKTHKNTLGRAGIKHHVAGIHGPVALVGKLLDPKITCGLAPLRGQKRSANVCADHAFVAKRINVSAGGLATAQLKVTSGRIGFPTGNYPVVVGTGNKNIFVPAGSVPPKLGGLHAGHAHLGWGGEKVRRSINAAVGGNPSLHAAAWGGKKTKILLVHVHAQRSSRVTGLHGKGGAAIR